MIRIIAVLNLFGLALSFVGGILLVYVLSMKSSNFRLVERENHDVAICLNGKVVATGFGGPLRVTDEPCPEGIGASTAAVIESEHPAFARWGLVLISVGFIFQMPAATLAVITAPK